LTLVCGEPHDTCECVNHKRIAGWDISGWNTKVGIQTLELEQDEIAAGADPTEVETELNALLANMTITNKKKILKFARDNCV
jgi:hypothetical protein